jgi:DNA primase
LNTSDTELFKKSDLIYGLDRARLAGQSAGRLAVVEGYTDVLMAHQHGVGNVVATMGTALTPLHIRQLRRYVPQVVLVYDADAGGATGVDRALELFVREDIDLAIATLPSGKDPCDLLCDEGPEPFKSALTNATDALDYKLSQVLERSVGQGVEGARRAVDAVLGVLAQAPHDAGSPAQLKRELIVGRIAQRFGMRMESVWDRLDEIRKAARPTQKESAAVETSRETHAAPAEPLERELLEVLLADPELVREARAEIAVDELHHPGLRRLLAGLYELLEEGEVPELDAVRLRIADRPQLADYALRMQEVGRMHADRPAWLRQIVEAFRARRTKQDCRNLQSQLSAAGDHNAAVDLLRRLQRRATTPAV